MADKITTETTPTLSGRARSLANLAPSWKPGQSGNPAGRPVGSRHKLSQDFCQAVLDDFKVHGAAAIISMREERPGDYAKMIAGMLTQEVEHSGHIATEPTGLSDIPGVFGRAAREGNESVN